MPVVVLCFYTRTAEFDLNFYLGTDARVIQPIRTISIPPDLLTSDSIDK